MAPEPGSAIEVEGVLNPATGHTPDGVLHLLPRLVARGNVSRVGLAEVVVDDGVPVGVERRGVVLEPETMWERGDGHGGVEDPRVTFVPRLGVHVMTYVAFGPLGPRIAIAVSDDLVSWRRLGPVLFAFEPEWDVDLNLYPNKDAVFFPEPVPGPDGEPCYAMLHRPMWRADWLGLADSLPAPASIGDDRPGIWISYVRGGRRRRRRAGDHDAARPPLCRPQRVRLRERQDRRRTAADPRARRLVARPPRRRRRAVRRLRSRRRRVSGVLRRGDAPRRRRPVARHRSNSRTADASGDARRASSARWPTSCSRRRSPTSTTASSCSTGWPTPASASPN